MADTHDTIDGLLAEFRGYLAGLPASYNFTTSCRDVRVMLDRFEAAHKRERGDCAKLREAVEESRRIASDLGGCRLNDYWELNEIVRVCEASLAAPPRNCDRFKTAAEAIDAYQDLTGDQLATDSGMKEWVEFAVWLFAPATEKEGGAR